PRSRILYPILGLNACLVVNDKLVKHFRDAFSPGGRTANLPATSQNDVLECHDKSCGPRATLPYYRVAVVGSSRGETTTSPCSRNSVNLRIIWSNSRGGSSP